MSQPSNYVLKEPATALQFHLKDMGMKQNVAFMQLVDADAEIIFKHGQGMLVEFDDFSTTDVNDGDYVVRIGEDIEVFSEEDFNDLFVKLG